VNKENHKWKLGGGGETRIVAAPAPYDGRAGKQENWERSTRKYVLKKQQKENGACLGIEFKSKSKVECLLGRKTWKGAAKRAAEK